MEQRSFLNINLVRIIVSWLQVWGCYTPEPMTLKKSNTHKYLYVNSEKYFGRVILEST